MFDYIIMDESSQVDLITGVLALSVAKSTLDTKTMKRMPIIAITISNSINVKALFFVLKVLI